MGYIEEIGMGLDNVYRWLAEAGQPEPSLRDTGGSFITLYGLGMEKALAEREAELIDLAALGLNERQQRTIVYLREQGRITNREYQSLFEVSYDTAHRDLRKLLEKGLVKRRGKGRATYYVLSI